MAAAGLYATAGDLGKFVSMLIQGSRNQGTTVLGAALVGLMLSEQLGIFHGGGAVTDQTFYFSHDGENYGFTANIQGYPNQDVGMAIMTNLNNVPTPGNAVGNATLFYFEVMAALQWCRASRPKFPLFLTPFSS
jgi:CubicO group peptidase (beta-lactamase class C family)